MTGFRAELLYARGRHWPHSGRIRGKSRRQEQPGTHWEDIMKNLKAPLRSVSLLSLILLAWMTITAYAQITPLGDSYTNTADPTTNYGAKTLLDVDGATQITYIQFNLASIPTTASISQATLKLYVNAVTKAGSFNVDYVNDAWAEGTIDASNAPALGTTIVSNVALTTADKNQYILINVTAAVQAWLNGSETNNGLALVANSTFNATFDSKESTTTSHPAELDIAFAGGDGTITGVTTTSGSGLTGGGTSGTLNLSLTNGCAANQVLQWNGSAWACAAVGTGTITGVTAGTDLTGGGTSGNVTLNLNTAATNAIYPQLAANNTFTGTQTVNNLMSISGASSSGVLNVLNTLASGSAPAVVGTTSSTDASGVKGVATTTGGTSNGVFGTTASAGGYGVLGSGPNVGAYGQAAGASITGSGIGDAGVWGDTGGSSGSFHGIQGTADDNNAGYFLNNSASDPSFGGATIQVVNESATAGTVIFVARGLHFGANCIIDVSGDLTCTGTKSAVVPVDGGSRNVALYAIEGPENWFEDAGSGQLSNGAALVNLDPVFGQTVNTGMEYHVFLTPNGDCKGLYVSQKTPTSFEVRELGGGTSGIAFDYRIMAKRKGYETIRLADKTSQFGKEAMERQKMRRPVRPSAAPISEPISEPRSGSAAHMPQLKVSAQPTAAQPR